MQVIIIGGGIAGLTCAYRLHEQGISSTILEARPRLGGRILTDFPEKRPTTALDYGPTWFWDDHIHIKKLLRELRIKQFPQYARGMSIYDNGHNQRPHQFRPPANPHAFRAVGGMQQIIDKLAKKLPDENIHLNTEVTHITADKDGITVQANQNGEKVYYDADKVVVAIPPSLANSIITYDPKLPLDVYRALQETHTWMGQAMKIFLIYDTPFWRKTGLSGHSVSHYDVVGEMHDVSPANLPFGILFGFLGNNSAGRNMNREQRQQAVVDQVKRLYGWQARDYAYYGEFNWAHEHYTIGSYRAISMTNSQPNYGDPLLQDPIMDGRLFWGASEVSTVSGGYVDGAIYRGGQIAENIIEKMKADT